MYIYVVVFLLTPAGYPITWLIISYYLAEKEGFLNLVYQSTGWLGDWVERVAKKWSFEQHTYAVACFPFNDSELMVGCYIGKVHVNCQRHRDTKLAWIQYRVRRILVNRIVCDDNIGHRKLVLYGTIYMHN